MDDVVTFLWPMWQDIGTCAAMEEDISEVSGLRTNLAKCATHLIRCSLEHGDMVQRGLDYGIQGFPATYLGLPLGLRKVTTAQLQPVVDKAANMLQPWSACLMNRGVRAMLVRTTLAAMPVYPMMSLESKNPRHT